MEKLADLAARSVMYDMQWTGEQLTPTPLEAVLAKMGAKISVIEGSDRLRRLGFKGFTTKSNQVALFSDTDKQYDVSLVGKEDGFARRFTLAHELAHIILDTDFREEEAKLDSEEREIVCDKAAARILVPDQLTLWFAKISPSLNLSLSEIEQLARKLRVSISVLITRLGELVNIRNGAFTVAMERSRVHDTNMAPRIKSRCMPKAWYLPLNKRLSSLGLGQLAVAFSDVSPFKEFREDVNIRLWNYDLRNSTKIEMPVTYKCYEVVDDTKAVRCTRRHMLVIFDGDLSTSICG